MFIESRQDPIPILAYLIVSTTAVAIALIAHLLLHRG
jgi:hypothetical protein